MSGRATRRQARARSSSAPFAPCGSRWTVVGKRTEIPYPRTPEPPEPSRTRISGWTEKDLDTPPPYRVCWRSPIVPRVRRTAARVAGVRPMWVISGSGFAQRCFASTPGDRPPRSKSALRALVFPCFPLRTIRRAAGVRGSALPARSDSNGFVSLDGTRSTRVTEVHAGRR